MVHSNPQKVNDPSKESKKAKKISSTSDLRAKLIAKLPNLKENIMQLDDKEI